MPHINLLPWREELRKRRQKEFAVIAAAVVAVMLLIVGGVHLQYSKMIEVQSARNKFLEDQIALLNKKIAEIRNLDAEKSRLLARMEIIQQLQSSRPEIVHLFDELVRTLPEGVYFTAITQRGKSLTLQGIAQSNARVSSLMRRMDASDWLTNPTLIEIKAQAAPAGADALRLSAFTLVVTQTRPKADEGEEAS